MVEELVPAEAAALEVFGDVPSHRLFAAERAVVAGAVASRVREFTTVRWAAAQCVRRLGHEPAPLLPGRMGAPRWPHGLVGSLTHCRGYRAAVVASTASVSGLGIDAEPDAPLPERVLAHVASAGERRHLAALRSADPEVRWDRLLFCAKEAFYKVWSPVMGTWLGFDEAEVVFHPAEPALPEGGFAVRLTAGPVRPGDSRRRPRGADGARFPALQGRWLARRGILVTAIAASVGELPGACPPEGRDEGRDGHGRDEGRDDGHDGRPATGILS